MACLSKAAPALCYGRQVTPPLLLSSVPGCVVVQDKGCGPEVDMWAVGVLTFYMLSGATPFDAADIDRILARQAGSGQAARGPGPMPSSGLICH
jgi:serine/threonine protein kinase